MHLLGYNHPNKTILLLHPDDSQKRQYLSQLLRTTQLIYIKISASEAQQTVEQITQNLEEQSHALTIDKSEPFINIIDEADNLSSEILTDLLHHFIKSESQAIIISDSLIFHFNQLSPEIQKHSTIINANTFVPNTPSSSGHILTAYGFGVGMARINGRKIDLIPGELSHEILFYILENPVVTREEMLEQFWQGDNSTASIASFHTARSKLDQILGIQFLQLHRGHYYQVNPKITIRYDVTQYRSLLKGIMVNPNTSDQQQRYQAAYKLYSPHFLLTAYADWVRDVRRKLQRMQSDVCYNLARIPSINVNSLGLLSQAFKFNPQREDVVKDMMQVYLDQNFPCDALDVYTALENELQKINIQPNQELQVLRKLAKEQCI